jgi:ribonuclease R
MASGLPKKHEILDLLAREGAPHKVRDIAAALGQRDRVNAIGRILDDLSHEGLVVALPGDGYKLRRREPKGLPKRDAAPAPAPAAHAPKSRRSEHPAPHGPRSHRGRSEPEVLEGILTVNARGFGFVATGTGNDVFVPREALSGALHGDRVKVSVVGKNPRGLEGAIAEIVQRQTKRVAGVLRRRGKSAWLEPDDTRIRGPIVLTAAVDVSGPEGNSGSDGDAAVVTITRFPASPEENPEGRLDAVLGRPGELTVEVQKILITEQIEELHGDQAVAEAEAYGLEVPASMLEGREDLTHIPLPTIDPEDARDHDDAVWVERLEHGGYRAWIAIADVSSYVRPGTKLDEEARARGCSVYLPNRAIPMLPRALSSNLCSLLPDVIRLCLCAVVELDAGANIKKTRLVRGYMKSAAKLTYGGVARALGFTEAPPREPKAEAMVEGLRVANELSRLLRAKRMKRGALDFELPEAKIILNENGEPTDVKKRTQDAGVTKAYQLIEELMLLANEVVAQSLAGDAIPTIYRIHQPPDQEKIVRFLDMCAELGIAADAEATQDPRALSELLKSFKGHESESVLNMLLLRSMKQATYDTTNMGHFGLASKAYVHFTSPIRRYPDLVVHRAVHARALGQKIDKSKQAIDDLQTSAVMASTNERKAMEVERAVSDLYRAVLMRDKVGMMFEGSVTAMVGSGIFVALDAPFVDVLIRWEDLGADRYELDESGLRAVAQRSGATVALGDRLMVEIIDVAILRRTVYGKRAASAEGEGELAPRRERGRGKPHREAKGAPRRHDDRGRDRQKPGRREHPKPGEHGKQGAPKGKKKNAARQVQKKQKKFGKKRR